MNLSVIIPAAGASARYLESARAALGAESVRGKLDEDLGGRPVLQRTVELFNKHPDVSQVIVAGPFADADFADFKDRHADKLALLGCTICRGGKVHRFETVAAALALVPAVATHVCVHDAARPCCTPDLIDRVFRAAAAGHAAVIPGVDVADTLKRVDAEWIDAEETDPVAAILGAAADGGAKGRRVADTVDRDHLVAVQTPQVFQAALLRRAYAQSDLTSTDDAQLIERLGEPVLVVPGESSNLKITRFADLALARAILGVKPPASREAHKRF